MMYRHSAVFLLVFMVSTPAWSQAQQLITLKEAIETGLEKNPKVNQMAMRLEQKSVEWKNQLGLQDPVAEFAREGISSSHTQPFVEQRFSFSQEIDFPLTSFLRIQALETERKAMEIEIEAVKKNIILNIKRYYIDVLYAQHVESLKRDERKLAQDLYSAVKQRKESGAGTEMDYLAAELTLLEAENQINDADRILHEARYTLFNYMGLNPPDQTYSIVFQDTLFTREDLINQQEALSHLTAHPEYQAGGALIRSQERFIQAQQSNFLPDLNLGYMRQDFGTGYQFNGIELGLKLPLWGAWKQRGQVQQAQMKKEEFMWAQTETYLDLKKRIELAWHSYENSKVILSRYRSGMREKAEKLRNLSMEAYTLGEIDLIKLIEAQRLYLSGQERFLDALRDYYIRLAELEYFIQTELVY